VDVHVCLTRSEVWIRMSWFTVAAPDVRAMQEEAEQVLKSEQDQSSFPRTLMVTSFFAGIVAGVILCRLFSTIHIPSKRAQEKDRQQGTKRDAARWGNETFALAGASVVGVKGSLGPRIKTYGERKMESLGLSWKTSGAGSSASMAGSSVHSRKKGKASSSLGDSSSLDTGFGHSSVESGDSDSQSGGMKSSDSKELKELKQSSRAQFSMSCSERLLASQDLRPGVELPEPEHHFVATCLFFDIVNFSKQCAERSSDQVRDWMLSVHTAVEELTVKHSIRVVECRGDCYICISGTNFTEEDVWETQMMRMVAFGCDVRNQLLAGDVTTRVRIGVAVGPLTIGYIGGNEAGGTNLVAYGDTINTAARMEQNGKEGMVLMTKSAAHRLCLEALDKDSSYNQSEIPVNVTYIKSKGLFPTVWFDCNTRNFTKAPRKVVDEQNRALRLSWPAGKEARDRISSQELLCSYQAL